MLADQPARALLSDAWGQTSVAVAGVISPRDPAFIFYTSGSTGTPKGVVLSHDALLAGQQWLQRTFRLSPEDRQLLRTTVSVTNLVREVFWPVLQGGTGVILPPGLHGDVDAHARIIRDSRVTVLVVVPALLEALIEHEAFAGAHSLRYVLCTSDTMNGDLPARFFAAGLRAELYNLYGLTEALYGAYWRCARGDRYRGFVPIGRSAELTMQLLDAQMRPVQPGEIGQLYLGGRGLTSGYWKRPELDAQKLVATPLLGCDTTLFATGDLACTRADGVVELLGRADDCVKIAGFRVELGEVEQQLRAFPGLADAVIVGHQEPTHTRLVAYVVPATGAAPAACALRAFLLERLPDYMVPVAFIPLDQLPLMHNGKIDRGSLQRRIPEPVRPSSAYAEPSDATERQLCELWAEALRVPRVGIHDDFFELGGDSVLAMIIASRAARKGVRVASSQLFEQPTVAQLARVALAVSAVPERSSARPAGASSRDLYPLTPMQTGMLLHSLVEPDSGVYFEQFVFGVEGRLELARYAAAWQRTLDLQPILRTSVAWRGLAQPVQRVQATAELALDIRDWRTLEGDAQAAAFEHLLQQDRAAGFDYEHGPLFRLTLLQLSDHRWRLLMSYHHLLLDAWSLFRLMRQALWLYDESSASATPAGVPDFSCYVAALGETDRSAAERYWREALAGFTSVSRLARGAARDARSGASRHLDHHAEQRIELSALTLERLREVSRGQRLTLNTVVQGAWALLLAAHTQQDDVLYGITISHRPVDLPAVEDMVGIFINTLPKRIRVERQASVRHWLERIQADQLLGRQHEHYPLADIQRVGPLGAGNPLFESLLIFENFPKDTAWELGLELQVRHERYLGWTNYPLAIEAMPAAAGLQFIVKYDTRHFDAAQIAEILRELCAILDELSERSQVRVGELRTAAKHAPRATVSAVTAADRVDTPDTPPHALEPVIAAVWARVLGRDEIARDASFFDLGGDSLKLFSVLSELTELGWALPIVELFQYRSVARLAERLALGPVAEQAPTRPARVAGRELERQSGLRRRRSR
jgi:non-ribosomal peptide synthetase component F